MISQKIAFQCTSNICIDKHYRYNGENNCSDKSDEIACKSCNDNMYHSDNKRFITVTKVYNGYNDCGDNSDELKRVSYDIQCDFQCKNNECAITYILCDVKLIFADLSNEQESTYCGNNTNSLQKWTVYFSGDSGWSDALDLLHLI